MSVRVAIVDTNVVAVALLTSRPDSPVSQLLDGMITAQFPYAVSHALVAEYRTVLARPKLMKLHGLDLDAIESLLVEMVRQAIMIKPVPAPPAPDPGDQMLWDILASRLDLVLVTGDKALLLDEGMSARVLSPASFVERELR